MKRFSNEGPAWAWRPELVSGRDYASGNSDKSRSNKLPDIRSAGLRTYKNRLCAPKDVFFEIPSSNPVVDSCWAFLAGFERHFRDPPFLIPCRVREALYP